MVKSRIVACIVAILLAVAGEICSAKIGEKCKNEYDCTDGVCDDWVCKIKCGDKTCQPGEYCLVAKIKCLEGAVCTSPPPKCVPKPDDIPPVKCGNIYCQPGETCETALVRCKEGSVCSTPPPKCVSNTNNIPAHLCDNVQCKLGYTCQVFDVNCLATTCPKTPRAQCVPTVNPCAYTTCLEGSDCVPSEEDPTIAKCVPRDACSNVRCLCGYSCEVVTIYCLIAPCPEPYAQCVPNNPCANTVCSDGQICTQKEDDPTVAQCVLSPCSTTRCGWGTKCEDFVDYCKSAPCSRPRGVCVADVEDNPCAVVDCVSGHNCRNVPVTTCEAPPCGKLKAVCEPVNPCDKPNPCPGGSKCVFDENNTAYCSPTSTCKEKRCDRGKECKIQISPCLVAPCPSAPTCVPKNKN